MILFLSECDEKAGRLKDSKLNTPTHRKFFISNNTIFIDCFNLFGSYKKLLTT